ncbi:MAG TPA: hypothetical protein VKA12_11880 [Roseiarcus sp.]|nr:hypothetical protein [Roseiarcus sp.]
MALSLAVAWLSGESCERLHELAGYVAGPLVLTRVACGFPGPRYARFSQFVRPAGVVVDYQAPGRPSRQERKSNCATWR